MVVGTFSLNLSMYPRSLTDPLFAFSYGAGTQFPRNPRAEDELAELAAELVRLENGMD